MKLLVLIGTDCHLKQLPHFLAHYAAIGVDQFVCGLHGHGADQARALLARYPFVIVADYGTEPYDEVAHRHWGMHFNDFRRQYCQPGEWCLFADIDELHEYPVDFFAQLDPQINAIRGKWVERLATPDGQLLPCLPRLSLAQQFPFATREIFDGISEKIMAVRADLDLLDGYHCVKGGTAQPVYYPTNLNVHHFRWDDRAASKYQNVKWTRHYQFGNECVPALRGVFAVDPPFPPAAIKGDQRRPAAPTTAAAPNDASSPPVIWIVGDGRSGTTWLANLINYQQSYRFMFEPLHPWRWRFLSQANPYLYLSRQTGAEYLPIFRQIFSGQLHDWRMDKHSQVMNNDNGLLIKDIFGHFCLKWVDQHFPTVKKVLLLRHPFAVALSKLKLRKLGWAWLDEPQQLFAHPQLYADFLQPFEEILQDVASNFEKQVLAWAIIHYVALVQLNGAQIHLLFYEELCANFEQEMRRLLAYLGEDGADQPLDERLLREGHTPSQTTTEWSAISQNGDLLAGWSQQLTAKEMGMGDYILNVFGLGQIYNSSRLMPDRQAAEFLLRASSLASVPDLSDSTPLLSVSTPTMGAPSAIGNRPGKLAYLIVAHHQPNHLARLIQALDDENSFFFIHIDEKVSIAPFQAAIGQHANLVFLSNRVKVEWGKFSVVQALLNLLQTAVASGHTFDYYTVLSGSDYPIKHKQEIYRRLQASDGQFLRIDRKLTHEANNSHHHFIRRLPQGKYFGNLTPYHGSMYWSLTHACVRFILDFVNSNPDYVAIHHYIFAPDEVFFHTLVKHSPFAGAITQDFSDGIYPDHLHHGNHFIDWAGRRKRTRLTLDERDFDDLLASPALFARKFDEQTASKLLGWLDRHVHCPYVKESVNHG